MSFDTNPPYQIPVIEQLRLQKGRSTYLFRYPKGNEAEAARAIYECGNTDLPGYEDFTSFDASILLFKMAQIISFQTPKDNSPKSLFDMDSKGLEKYVTDFLRHLDEG
jgi:hypothetical protein